MSETNSYRITVINPEGEEAGEREVFLEAGEADKKGAILQRVIVTDQWNELPRTVKTKTISEVSGGGRKPWRQKGTGRARHGSTRSPLWRGGGVVFGPQPNTRVRRLPKKTRRRAFEIAWQEKLVSGGLTLIRGALDRPQAKRAASLLDKRGVSGKVLFLWHEDGHWARSFRNLSGVRVSRHDCVSLSDILWADHVILTEETWDSITIWHDSSNRVK